MRALCLSPAARRGSAVLLPLAAGIAAGLLLVTRLDAAFVVSQKGRVFQPSSLVVARGDAVTIVNDDSDLLHHVYVDAESFTFDSGDQAPGSRTQIAFPKSGTFQVLCGIHPKMKLIVRVN